MGLRYTGQLMLGVVRIYGRKVQYLMDDCKDTRERITMAFRPGMVDLPEDQIRATRNAITFTDHNGANIDPVDVLDWSFNVPDEVAPSRGLHAAPLTQGNLLSGGYGAFNFGRPAPESIFGDDNASRQGSHDETSHLDSQDFGGIDLGIMDDDWDMSMEQGRDALRERSRSKSHMAMSSPHPAGQDDLPAMDIDMHAGEESHDFGGIDLGLDLNLDLDNDNLFDLPELVAPDDKDADAERTRRETSALSTPPPQSPPASTVDVTPRTAKRIADVQEKGKPIKRVRIARADEELELGDEEFVAPKEDDSDILAVERYIPADPESALLDDVIENPTKHFLPSVKVDAETLFFAGPAGLAPELSELFLFNTNVLRRHRGVDEAEEQRAAKKARHEAAAEDEDDDIEEGRRESRAPSEVVGGFGFDPDHGMDTFEGPADVTFDMDGPMTPMAKSIRASSIAASFRDMSAIPDDGEYPLAMFDPRGPASSTQADESDLGTPQKSVADSTTQAGGVSKSTAMAMGLLRREIEAIQAEDPVVNFDKVARGASKRAAAGFFFELLVLGTRDCVRLDQNRPFGNIQVRAKEKLWEP